MISLYYHVFVGNERWPPIAREYIAALKAAGGIGDAITVGLVGEPDDRRYARQWWEAELGPSRFTEADEGWEQVTLAKLWADARRDDPGDLICYAHAKGSYQPSTMNTAWRQSMTDRVISNWRAVLPWLDRVDAAGCHWLTPAGLGVQTPMFAGNFWWATAGYVQGLPEPDLADPDRFAAERWIGLGWPKVTDLRRGFPDATLFTLDEIHRAERFEMSPPKPREIAVAAEPGKLPLVTVITPTWQRHEMLLTRCMPSVQAQTYPNIEHVIVSDGPDPELDALIRERHRYSEPRNVALRWEFLSPDQRGGRWGVKPRLEGLKLATGSLITYLDDDDAYRPDHVATLVGALQEHPEAGFAYSRMASHGSVDEPPGGVIIGGEELGPCAVGSPMIMHRRELTEIATWGPPNDMEDWRLVNRWLERGVTAWFVPIVTVDVWPSSYRGE